MTFKKILGVSLILVMLLTFTLTLTSCENQALTVEHNLTLEADNFNIVRSLTVINGITDDIVFSMTGKMSITADTADNQLEVLVEESEGVYKKHFIGLSDNTFYVIEDITNNEVDNYNYTLNFNPKMWFPWKVETVD